MTNGNIITWDLETKGFAGPLVIGGIYTGQNYFTYRTWEDFYFLLKGGIIPAGSYLYAHNGAKYDNRYIMETALKHGFEITNIMYIQNGLTFTLKYKKRRWYIRDSYHLLPGSLKNLCIDFDIAHKKKDFDIEAWGAQGWPLTEELKEYLKFDCISLYELLEVFKDQVEGDIKRTLASTAFNQLLKTTYKKKPLKEILKNFLNKHDEKEIRQAYKGGRVEVFKRKGQDLYKYDVNSLYPWAMYKYNYPFGFHHTITDPARAEQKIKAGELGIYKCNIYCPYMKYPYLALKKDNKLIFPVGTWQDWITSFEIEEARKRGYKIDIIKGHTFEHKGKLFKPFVNKNYEIKKTSSGAKKQVAKLFLNSAYGKFGQRREVRNIYTRQELIEKDIDLLEVQPVGPNLYQQKKELYMNRSINPVVAAFVTAYARHELYLGMEDIINRGGEIYYIDTDCIVSDIELSQEHQDSQELGKWDFEGFIKRGVFISPKLYALQEADDQILIKAKGVDQKLKENLSYKIMESLIYSDKEISFNKKRVSGVLEHFKRHETDKQKFISQIGAKKSISGKYDKRVLAEDRIKSQPIEIRQI